MPTHDCTPCERCGYCATSEPHWDACGDPDDGGTAPPPGSDTRIPEKEEIMKAGDQYEPTPSRASITLGGVRTVVSVGRKWLLYEFEGVERAIPRADFEERFEKIEPFFEAGKTYRHRGGDTFAVERVDRDGDGGRVAYGLVTPPGVGKPAYWAMRTHRITTFSSWSLVEEMR